MEYRIHVGTNALSGKELRIPLKEFTETHAFIPGRTGMGKTYLFENFARQIIDSGHALILIDGKAGEGELYDRLLNFCVDRRLERKTVLIDPADSQWSPGINYLELFEGTSPEALSDLVLEAMMKFFKEEDEYKPWLEEWGPASLLPLIEGGFTLLELFAFTSQKEPDFRDTLLRKIDKEFYVQKWQELTAFKPPEQARILNVLKTRASRFWSSEPLKNIFGQTKTTIDWLKVMEEGGIVLCKLGSSGKLPGKTASFIGAAIVHQMLLNAPRRPGLPGKRRPVFFMVDEAQRFICRDFADGLNTLRSYGIFLFLACQFPSQLEEIPAVYSSVMNNCGNKFVFSISNKEAEEMEGELFPGERHKPQVKDEIWQTKLRPIETTREIVADATGQVRGSVFTSMQGSGSGTSLDEKGDLIISHNSSSSSSGRAEQESSITTQTVTRVPWNEYEEYQEVTSRSYYTLEEIKERYRAWVVKQDRRHLQMKLGSKKPIPVVTAEVKPIRVLPSAIAKFKEAVYRKTARPTAEVTKEIEARVAGYLQNEEAIEYPTNFREPKPVENPALEPVESFREPKT